MGVRLALGVVALVAFVAASCSITARSDEFRCQVAGDCSDGRACVDGWCVTDPGDGGAGAIDGSSGDGGLADAGGCPSACDRCQRGTCVISCEGSGACQAGVVCPVGMPCEVHCDGTSACQGGVDCSDATACSIECSDTGACGGLVACGAGRCEVECNGTASCASGIDCSASCRCDTACDGLGACAIEPTCPSDDCVDGIDCTDTGATCRGCQ
jgi:hypothetical protein